MQFRLWGGCLCIHRNGFWYRRIGPAFVFKYPWATAYFSERYGYWQHTRFLGFRWGYRS